MSSYDAFADSFAAHAEDSAYNAHYDRPAVLGLLGDVSGRRVLDVGCGSGLYAEELTRRGAKVVAFDSSSKLVSLARRRVSSQADVRVHDLEDPIDWLADGSIDQAIMALVLHHLADPVSALREIHRTLKPGGRLVVSTAHPTADWQQLGGSYFTDEMLDDTWNSGWEVRFRRAPLTVWCAEFREAGFVIERLVEPLPAESMRERFPETFDKLSNEPFFIVFVLQKSPVAGQ
ncbi:class I SAM-dependent methyltransferase [Solicola gregarius]|uniref:Class I SAM-dependent methyltransferase n=1 Tax=Solicola gregarius TaxID=2908642 RepID=A0AA46TH69_9ACTN|nr:class I SAM-dependent methyltransferase [Solicola gregarius]UYM05118.1 class I SAM-dependent methyltransferase [Solicola gregarius]